MIASLGSGPTQVLTRYHQLSVLELTKRTTLIDKDDTDVPPDFTTRNTDSNVE